MAEKDRDADVMRLYEQLVEIEQRLIPTGLHVFGRQAELKEKTDLLRMVASFDRPEHGTRALPKLVAEALGIEGYDALLQEATASETKELIDAIALEAVQQFCRKGADSAVEWLNSRARVDREQSLPIFLLLATITEQLDSNKEVESLLRALRGESTSRRARVLTLCKTRMSCQPAATRMRLIPIRSLLRWHSRAQNGRPTLCFVVISKSAAAIRAPWLWRLGTGQY